MKVLVSVASRHGSTLQIAECIREELEALGMRAHVVEPDMVVDLSRYDAVVLGSAVYSGRWLAPARKLAARLAPELRQRPLWLFSSGPIGDPAKPLQPSAEALELARTLNARDHQVFNGRLNRDMLGLTERAVVRIVGAASGDYREWLEIGAWARGIADTLIAEEASAASAVATPTSTSTPAPTVTAR
jgi:menaquinone-dependent protoporphyrinogen oxidase